MKITTQVNLDNANLGYNSVMSFRVFYCISAMLGTGREEIF